MKRKLKNSVGIWAFGPTATRFVPARYRPELSNETMEARTERVLKGLGEFIDGYEYHYPNEINENNVSSIKEILASEGKDIYCIALGHHTNPKYSLGSLVNPFPEIRKEAINIAKDGIDLASSVGANFIIWPGGEGYNYPFQTDYEKMWNDFIDAIAILTEQANKKGVTIFLEHKNSEPAMKVAMRSIGMTLYVINKVKERGVDTSNLKVNMDWQHLIMNGENLAEYARLLAMENKLGHQHANSGWGTFDDDSMVGALRFVETLELAKELQLIGYGKNGERIGFDLLPYTEDAIEAVKESVIHWEFIYDLAYKINIEHLYEAKRTKDAVKAYKEVYKALGAKF
ncbi:xylose isomerase [Thermoanaerobacter uzonensis DSM 18761]|uniref:Xylose isomerase n=1 Tax=Thermoanaerobacter uzonensis DSM 18761 TaxID=1123369 RepID=A0A1M4SE36_9THEO|nr:TIM barrel protein [Thermoanaerobacter uzonensis]SHE30504.1 xylose isomerase [Thermoanaerobacter uzonensis DSM 18761]